MYLRITLVDAIPDLIEALPQAADALTKRLHEALPRTQELADVSEEAMRQIRPKGNR